MMILNCIILGMVALTQGCPTIPKPENCKVQNAGEFPFGLDNKKDNQSAIATPLTFAFDPNDYKRPEEYDSHDLFLYKYLSGCQNLTVHFNSPTVTDCPDLAVKIGIDHKPHAQDKRGGRHDALVVPLTTTLTVIKQVPKGGLISLTIPTNTKCKSNGRVNLTVSGTGFFSAPHYVLGIPNMEEIWKGYRNSPVPWTALIVEKTISFFLPSEVALKLKAKEAKEFLDDNKMIVQTLRAVSGRKDQHVRVTVHEDDRIYQNGDLIAFPIRFAKLILQPDFKKTWEGGEYLATLSSLFATELWTTEVLVDRLHCKFNKTHNDN